MRRPRVLHFGEAVTLAHVARTLVLADALVADHDVTVALAPHAHRLVPADRFAVAPLDSIPGERFVDALRRGAPVYDEATLARYFDDDLRLIDRVRPDLVVGDFRLSLSVSARLRRVPYLSVTNAYWSPWYREPPPLPVLPWTRWVPLPLARAAFALARAPAMAAHTVPLNRVRARHGLPSLGRDLRRAYTDADHVAYADVPELFPTPGAPDTHAHLGPVLWSPPGAPPAWWDAPLDGRSAYVTMGSSGDPRLLDAIVRGLDALGVTAIVASAGAHFVPPQGSRARVAPFLPGLDAARRADLVVCNGGSMTVQQALAAGRPVLGVASNMDQFLNMGAVGAAGAGLCLRADRLDAAGVRRACAVLLGQPAFADTARHLSSVLARHSAPQRFRQVVGRILSAGSPGDLRDEKDLRDTDPGVRAAADAGLHAGVGHEPPAP